MSVRMVLDAAYELGGIPRLASLIGHRWVCEKEPPFALSSGRHGKKKQPRTAREPNQTGGRNRERLRTAKPQDELRINLELGPEEIYLDWAIATRTM